MLSVSVFARYVLIDQRLTHVQHPSIEVNVCSRQSEQLPWTTTEHDASRHERVNRVTLAG